MDDVFCTCDAEGGFTSERGVFALERGGSSLEKCEFRLETAERQEQDSPMLLELRYMCRYIYIYILCVWSLGPETCSSESISPFLSFPPPENILEENSQGRMSNRSATIVEDSLLSVQIRVSLPFNRTLCQVPELQCRQLCGSDSERRAETFSK